MLKPWIPLIGIYLLTTVSYKYIKYIAENTIIHIAYLLWQLLWTSVLLIGFQLLIDKI